jgi:hypothetical protein
MTNAEALAIAQRAFDSETYPPEQVLAALVAFGLITIDEPKHITNKAVDILTGKSVWVDQGASHGGYRGPLSPQSAGDLVRILAGKGFKIVEADI